MKQVEEIIEQVTSTLGDVAQSEVVVGSPMAIGQVTVVAISRISVGFGGAGGEGRGASGESESKEKKREGSGGGQGSGSGGAAVVRPVAVVVLSEERVDVLPIPEKQGKLGKLIDQIPDLVERIQGKGAG